jgi:flagellar biosynthesis protein FliQ
MTLRSAGPSPDLDEPPELSADPAAPDRGLGRYMRALVGIKEEVLDYVPTDRPRYTGLGIIVLNTGLLAALAMLSALDKIVTAPWPVLILAAMAWGWIILTIDRWLISSTHGTHLTNKTLIFVPRLLLAILIAVSIAEPLTLRIFQLSIYTRIHHDRSQALLTYGSRLKLCNPTTGVLNTAPSCAHYQLPVGNSPTILGQELTNAKQQESQTQNQVNGIESHLAQLQNAARDECAGISGNGLSGLAGVGYRCKHDYAAVASYKASSGLTPKLHLLNRLQAKVATLNTRLAQSKAGFSGAMTAAIKHAIVIMRDGQGKVGLLDEWKALGELASQSTIVLYGRWLVWLLLIMLDCLPILSKLMNGETAYDRRLSRRVETYERIGDVDEQLREQRGTIDKEAEILTNDSRRSDQTRQAAKEDRVKQARDDAELIRNVEMLAKQWIREGVSESGDY